MSSSSFAASSSSRSFLLTRRHRRNTRSLSASSSSSSSSSESSKSIVIDATFGGRRRGNRRDGKRNIIGRTRFSRALTKSASNEESTRKINYDDDDDDIALGGTTEGEEPDVFDLMSATIVPYEKTYRLCFLRHAKSSYSRWAYSSGDEIEKEGEDEEDNFDLPDKYRSIAPRGKIGAQAVAKMLVSEFSEYVPSIIITSDATRCLDTVECFSVAEPDAFGKTTVILAPEFYEVAHGSDVKAKRIRKAIAEKIRREAQMRGAETVCVVGHNAGWENVVKLMTKSSKKVRMKTSNCALLSCKAGEMTWEEALMEGEWELEKILRVPKELNRKAKLDYPEEGSGNWKEEENEAEEDEDDEGGEIFFDEYVTTE